MSGNREGGLKTAATNKAKWGDNFYSRIGKLSNQAWVDNGKKPRGFAYAKANGLDWHKKAGKKGGKQSRRGRAVFILDPEPFAAGFGQKNWWDRTKDKLRRDHV